MIDYGEKNNPSEEITLEFRNRVKQNIEDAMNEKFSSQILPNIPGVLIKVKLERAVFEYALIFRRYVERMVTHQYKNYIIDLSDTLFLDSTFLGSIIVLLKKIDRIGGTLRVVVNSEKMVLIAQIKSVGDIMETFSSVDEAITNI
ncbi:MAG: STAS domain-containing protein [Melioribacteraceae bacterium]|nr:STAS domain-containing protein [Melioribacteraceae bacterium]